MPTPPSALPEPAGLLQEYADSACEHLATVERCLLHLEGEPGSMDHVHRALRAFHTLKGSSALMGLAPIEHLSHLAENLLAQARAGTVEMTGDRTDAALRACDVLRCLVSQARQLAPGQRLQSPDGYDEMARQLTLASTPPREDQQPATPPPVPADLDIGLIHELAAECIDRIRQCQARMLATRGRCRPDDLAELRQTIGCVQQAGQSLGLEPLEEVSTALMVQLNAAAEGTIDIEGQRLDVLQGALDGLMSLLDGYASAVAGEPVAVPDGLAEALAALADPQAALLQPPLRVGEILLGRGQVQPERLVSALSDRSGDLVGRVLLRDGAARAGDVSAALGVQRQLEQANPGEATVRVSTRRLDALVDLVGELLVTHSMMSENPVIAATRRRRRRRAVAARGGEAERQTGELGRLSKDLHGSGKLLRELHSLAVSLRMVPMRGLFEKAQRLVRDLSRRSSKRIELTTEGEDTEIDRNTVELLTDPLVHMIRNAVDHGVEPAEQRSAGGKDPVARLTLIARPSGSNVLLSLRDDGRGLDLDRIRAKAVELGLAPQGQAIGDTQAIRLIFEPGFSTAEKVTGVSGRGVGMDVVRRNIEALHGRIDVHSRFGEGTCFELRLPMTTAVEDVLVLSSGAQRFLVPASEVQRAVPRGSLTVEKAAGGLDVVVLEDTPVPVIRLARLLGDSAASPPPGGQLVVLAQADCRCVLDVDAVLSQAHVVVKPLGRLLAKVPWFVGGAVLGDGQVGLILDVAALMRIVRGDGSGGRCAA